MTTYYGFKCLSCGWKQSVVWGVDKGIVEKSIIDKKFGCGCDSINLPQLTPNHVLYESDHVTSYAETLENLRKE